MELLREPDVFQRWTAAAREATIRRELQNVHDLDDDAFARRHRAVA